MRILFFAVWLAHLAFIVASAAWLPEQIGPAGRQMGRTEYLAFMGAVGALVPLMVGPGMLLAQTKLERSGLNLPYAGYWFHGERRAASLQRLAPHLYGMAAWVSVFLSAQHGLEVLGTQESWWHWAATGVLLVAITAHVLLLRRAYPAPPPEWLLQDDAPAPEADAEGERTPTNRGQRKRLAKQQRAR